MPKLRSVVLTLSLMLGFALPVAASPVAFASSLVVDTVAIDRDPFDGTFEFTAPVFVTEIRTFRQSRSLYEFSAGTMASGDTVNAATLAFNIGSILGTLTALEVHAFAGDGIAEALDAQTLNLIASLTPTTGVNNVDVTSALQTLLDGGASHFGFFLRATTSGGNGNASVVLQSPTSLTGTFTQATVAVPEPGTLVLAGLAFGGALVVSARRRRPSAR